jgi:hypothetical protein
VPSLMSRCRCQENASSRATAAASVPAPTSAFGGFGQERAQVASSMPRTATPGPGRRAEPIAALGGRGGRQGREHRRPSDHRRYIPQLLELVRTGVIAPSTVPSRSATCPRSSTPTTVDQRQTGWTKVALDTRPDTLSAYCDAERDLVSDSVTAQEVLGHLVDEEALVAVAVAVAVAETHGASTDLARPARDRARGRLPRR